MPFFLIFLVGLLCSTFGLAGLYSTALQTHANLVRGQVVDVAGPTVVLYCLLLVGGIFMLAMAYKNYEE